VKPRRSVQRLYMRKSMSAQSFASVPPAPDWMDRMALFLSNWPVRNEAISSLSSSATMAATCRSSSLAEVSFSAPSAASMSSTITSTSPSRL